VGINSYKLGCRDKAFLVSSLCNFSWATNSIFFAEDVEPVNIFKSENHFLYNIPTYYLHLLDPNSNRISIQEAKWYSKIISKVMYTVNCLPDTEFSYYFELHTVNSTNRYCHRRRLGGSPGTCPPIIEKRPCIYHFLPPFAPQYFGLTTQYF